MTRRLIASGQRPVTVGTFFSLGHSTYVVSFHPGSVSSYVILSGVALAIFLLSMRSKLHSLTCPSLSSLAPFFPPLYISSLSRPLCLASPPLYTLPSKHSPQHRHHHLHRRRRHRLRRVQEIRRVQVTPSNIQSQRSDTSSKIAKSAA